MTTNLSRIVLLVTSWTLLTATTCRGSGIPQTHPDLPFLLVSDCDKHQQDVTFHAASEAKEIYQEAASKIGVVKGFRVTGKEVGPKSDNKTYQAFKPLIESPVDLHDDTIDYVLGSVNSILKSMSGPPAVEITCGYSWITLPKGQQYAPKKSFMSDSFGAYWRYDNRTSVDKKLSITDRWFRCLQCADLEDDLHDIDPSHRPKAAQFWDTKPPATSVMSLSVDNWAATWERVFNNGSGVVAHSLEEVKESPPNTWDLGEIYRDSMTAYLVSNFFRAKSLRGSEASQMYDYERKITADAGYAQEFNGNGPVKSEANYVRYNRPQEFTYLLLSLYLSKSDSKPPYKPTQEIVDDDETVRALQAYQEAAEVEEIPENIPEPVIPDLGTSVDGFEYLLGHSKYGFSTDRDGDGTADANANGGPAQDSVTDIDDSPESDSVTNIEDSPDGTGDTTPPSVSSPQLPAAPPSSPQGPLPPTRPAPPPPPPAGWQQRPRPSDQSIHQVQADFESDDDRPVDEKGYQASDEASSSINESVQPDEQSRNEQSGDEQSGDEPQNETQTPPPPPPVPNRPPPAPPVPPNFPQLSRKPAIRRPRLTRNPPLPSARPRPPNRPPPGPPGIQGQGPSIARRGIRRSRELNGKRRAKSHSNSQRSNQHHGE